MRSIQALGLTCIALLNSAAMAEDTAGPLPHQAAPYLVVERSTSTTWQSRAAVLRQDRLNYLNGSLCLEQRGCSTAFRDSSDATRVAERDYIDSLSLGTYGPMKVKFTGDRVKLKVRF